MGNWFLPVCSAAAGSGGPDTFWLVFTNIALGLAVLVACLWIAWGIVLEKLSRRRSRRATAAVSAVRAI